MNDKIGRNDPCTCGSGKKYKNCCLNKPSLADRMKNRSIKAKWLNEPQGVNLMERMFGDSINSAGKKFERHNLNESDKDISSSSN